MEQLLKEIGDKKNVSVYTVCQAMHWRGQDDGTSPTMWVSAVTGSWASLGVGHQKVKRVLVLKCRDPFIYIPPDPPVFSAFLIQWKSKFDTHANCVVTAKVPTKPLCVCVCYCSSWDTEVVKMRKS